MSEHVTICCCGKRPAQPVQVSASARRQRLSECFIAVILICSHLCTREDDRFGNNVVHITILSPAKRCRGMARSTTR